MYGIQQDDGKKVAEEHQPVQDEHKEPLPKKRKLDPDAAEHQSQEENPNASSSEENGGKVLLQKMSPRKKKKKLSHDQEEIEQEVQTLSFQVMSK